MSRLRASVRIVAGAAGLGGTALVVGSLLGHRPAIALDSDARRDVDHPSNKRPPVLWNPPSRKEMLDALKKGRLVKSEEEARGRKEEGVTDGEFDLLVVGGGATGTGVALDAASRGLKVALVERGDFGSGTSSKSTKLVHGGVRYLQKAVFNLDYEQVRPGKTSSAR